MIIADFFKDPDGRLRGFRVSGHAGMADCGQDICCASVSSAVMMTANTVTEAFRLDAKVSVEENEIMLKLANDEKGEGDKVLLGLLAHMYFLSGEFAGCIRVRVQDTHG